MHIKVTFKVRISKLFNLNLFAKSTLKTVSPLEEIPNIVLTPIEIMGFCPPEKVNIHAPKQNLNFSQNILTKL